MALMTDRGHQEEGEAAGKWRRALLTSAQLSTYYVGYHEVATSSARCAAPRPQATARCTTRSSPTARRRRVTCAPCSACRPTARLGRRRLGTPAAGSLGGGEGWAADVARCPPSSEPQPTHRIARGGAAVATIEAVGAREILDSRGNPTVEVEVALDDGTIARAAVPSGASTGAFEAVERRDGDKGRYGGKGVEQAVDRRHRPDRPGAARLRRRPTSASSTRRCSTWTAPTTRARIGANAILGVSLAVAKAAADSAEPAAVPLRRRPERARAAGPDDEHPQRWRARRRRRRHPGVHDRPDRRGDLPGGAALGRRDLPHAEVGAQGQGAGDRPRRRGRLRPEPADQPGRAGAHRRRDRAGRLHASAATSRWRSTSRPPSSTPTARYRFEGKQPAAATR